MNNDTFSISIKLFEHNQKELLKKNNALKDYYSEYKNEKKILILLEFWLYGFRALMQEYGKEGVLKFCNDNKTSSYAHFSWLFEYNADLRIGDRAKPSEINFYLLSRFLKKYTGAGAPINNFFDKLRWRISRKVLLSMPISFRPKRKAELIDLLIDILELENDLTLRESLEKSLPLIFFADQLSVANQTPSNISIEISPDVLMNFVGLENIFLYDKNINLIGFQHGGGYGTYKVEYFEEFERRLSDKFYGWGLLESNKPQHRYKKLIQNSSEIRFVWIERSKLPKLSKYFFPSTYHHALDFSVIVSIFNILKDLKISYYNLAYRGMSFCSLYNNYRGLSLHNSGVGEKSLKKNDILIFDNIYSSLIFFCIENSIIFLIITSQDDYKKYTRNNKDWFLTLYRNNFAFYNHEEEKIKDRINELTNDNLTIPTGIVDFHNNTFINI